MEDSLTSVAAGVMALARSSKALSERVDYLHVAVMRGDPRFTKPEFADPDFDGEAFDKSWLARGKRVPLNDEIYGE